MYNYRNQPFFSPPFSRRNSYINSYSNTRRTFESNPNNQINFMHKSDYNSAHFQQDSEPFTTQVSCPPENDNNRNQKDEALFEILGLKIYFDDLLLICILLFLYQEGIQDEYLFISLIFLLLS